MQVEVQRRIMLSLPITLLLLNIADIISTHVGLTYFGLIETNSIYGILMVPVKILLCIFLIAIFFKVKGKLIIPLTTFTLTLTIIYLFTVINNVSLLVSA